jgi:uncharacterized protein (TIGR00255 family)
MTGFARISGSVAASPGNSVPATWTLALKSVNHRFLDLHLRLPSGMDALEMQLRRLLKERIVRGHLELTLTWEQAAAVESTGYDTELVARYLAAFQDMRQQHNLRQEPDLNAILRLPGIFRVPGSSQPQNAKRGERDEALESLQAAVLPKLDTLIDALNGMRQTEGAALAAVLLESLARLENDIAEAAELRRTVRPAHFQRLQARVKELVAGTSDDIRLLQEAALLADRSDVEEELARLRVHIEHFRSLLRQGGEVGKKLDFLLQEMNREANTLLSKSAGIAGEGSRLTMLGLGMKSEIEKAREQVQNLE